MRRVRYSSLKCFCTRSENKFCRPNHRNYSVAMEEQKINTKSHLPVMVNEVIAYLDLQPGSLFIDMTFGAGGHSKALLEKVPQLQVIALDRDPVAVTYAEKLNEEYPGQVIPVTGKFTDLPDLLKELKIKPNTVDGILFDLGASSMQFDTPERGFSISHNGPLDMRMDGGRDPNGVTAADVLAYAGETDLAKIFKIYGGEKRAKKFARVIEEARHLFKPLTTTHDLCQLLEAVSSEIRHDKLNRFAHVGTKVFQALRIFVNDELNEINNALTIVHHYLKTNGRIVLISFHSLEDTIAKRHFFNQLFHTDSYVPAVFTNMNKTFTNEEVEDLQKKLWQPLNKKVVLPTEVEIALNPRSRSAKLRAAIKLEFN